MLFLLVVLILGLIQPGYNHFVDTISVLVLGQWGWIQNVNFFILAVTTFSFGIGLSISLEKKTISFMSFVFSLIALCIISLIFLSADAVDRTKVQLITLNSLHGLIHLFVTMAIVGLTIPLVIRVTNKMKKNPQFRTLTRYTTISFTINIVAGILWFIFRRYGILFEWKGLWQKMMAVIILVWMGVMGKVMISAKVRK